MIRIVHIHLQIRILFQDPVSDFFIDRRGIQRIPLVTAASVDFESTFQPPGHCNRLIAYCIKIVFRHFDCRAYAVHAENVRDPFDHRVQVAEPAHEDSSVMYMYIRTHASDGIADLPYKHPYKVWPIQAFQEYFPVTYQEQILHDSVPPIIF